MVPKVRARSGQSMREIAIKRTYNIYSIFCHFMTLAVVSKVTSAIKTLFNLHAVTISIPNMSHFI